MTEAIPPGTQAEREMFEKWWNEQPSIDGVAYIWAWSAWKARALHSVTAQGEIDGPRRGPLADGSQTPNDAAAIPCAKAGSSPAARGYCHAIVCGCNQGKGAADCSNWEPNE